MSGIYIHIPFCKQACNYCNFHFSTSLLHKDAMMQAIEKEIGQRAADETIDTIYFGGGTPGILSKSDLALLMNAIKNNFRVNKNVELTLETNPDDINPITLEAWLELGINRLSIGIQSFDDIELKWMNRAHDAAKSKTCLQQIEQAGFTNYSADLIYGSPKQTLDILKKNIDELLNFNVPHISSYALTVEEKTVLHKNILQGKEKNTDSSLQAEMFYFLIDQLQQRGITQYEISNFAKDGFESKHNSSYWQAKPYLGFGPSAHSYDGSAIRSWNVADNKKYIEALNNNLNCRTDEILTPSQQRNEMIMLGLRTRQGVDLKKFESKFGTSDVEELIIMATTFIEKKQVKKEDDFLFLTKEGKFLADGIAADLFII